MSAQSSTLTFHLTAVSAREAAIPRQRSPNIRQKKPQCPSENPQYHNEIARHLMQLQRFGFMVVGGGGDTWGTYVRVAGVLMCRVVETIMETKRKPSRELETILDYKYKTFLTIAPRLGFLANADTTPQV